MKIFSLILILSMSGCAVSEKYQKGDYARTSVSKSYKGGIRRLAVLPFVTSDGKVKDYDSSDELSTILMEMEFTIVDRSQIEAVFKELKLNLTGAISEKEIKKVGEMLSVDALVFGTVSYNYIPGKSAVFGNIGSSSEGYSKIRSKSIRIVSVETAEVLLSAYCCKSGYTGKSRIVEISRSIDKALNPGERKFKEQRTKENPYRKRL